MAHFRLHILALLLMLNLGMTTPAAAQAVEPDDFVTRAENVFVNLQEFKDWDRAFAESEALLDEAIATLDAKHREAWCHVASAHRIVSTMAESNAEHRFETAKWLHEHPDVRHALAFAMKPEEENSDGLYTLLAEMIKHRGTRLPRYPELTAALCIVHDVPMVRRTNENRTSSAHPIHLFDYFTANEDKTWFGMKRMPARLLAYVVDTTASIDEMRWAAHTYRRCNDIGALFFEIEYDHDHYQTGAEKMVTQRGFTLQNIRQFGGVCADQAYFAMTVGKSLGVPTTYTVGRSGVVGHAWVGVLEADRRRSWWNFNSGRYEAYQGVRGQVLDPQTRDTIPDSYVAILAGYGMSKTADRFFVGAMLDAASRMDAYRTGAAVPSIDAKEPVRDISVKAQLDLVEAGLRGCAAYPEAWTLVARLAERGQLSADQKLHWAGALDRMCGDSCPDFYLDILAPMIATVDNVDQQLKLWERAFGQFSRRKDLAAAVRLYQAEMFLDHDDPAKAARCYEDVVARFANDGPFVLTALTNAENLYAAHRAGQAILNLYEMAWSNLKRPDTSMAATFARQSNWYQIGTRYARWLDQAGRPADARKIRSRIRLN